MTTPRCTARPLLLQAQVAAFELELARQGYAEKASYTDALGRARQARAFLAEPLLTLQRLDLQANQALRFKRTAQQQLALC